MRNFVISTICLLIIVVLWGAFHLYSFNKTDKFETSIDIIVYEYIEKGQWDEAVRAFESLHSEWSSFKHIASFFLDSSAVNHIDNTFRKIKHYVYACDVSNSSGELAYLKGLFISLHNSEALSFGNIL